jgi:hypothetical protein
MSIALVSAEIERFLVSTSPEVLCIKGQWGVGKTYSWRHYLSDVAAAKKLGLKHYSYVSLFGLNSLEEVRYAIFENRVVEAQVDSGADFSTFQSGLASVRALARKGRWILDYVPKIRDISPGISKALFLSIRNQIVCFDDLERAGPNLEIRGVLGLASQLREQRGCKIAFLLNDEQLSAANSGEFNRQLEKVIDTSLVFDPTSEEAVSIAIEGCADSALVLKQRLVSLGLTNIRVIKKIERITNRLEELLTDFPQEIIDQAVMTVVLAGWSVFQPDLAPPPSFIRQHTRSGAIEPIANEPPEEQVWRARLDGYGFIMADDLDGIIISGVEAGYFDETRLLQKAEEMRAILVRSGKNSFVTAWDKYHQSLSVPDDELLEDLYLGLKENIDSVSALNFNNTILLLREFGPADRVQELIGLFVQLHKDDPGMLQRDVQTWAIDPVDEELVRRLRQVEVEFVDTRDPAKVIQDMVRNNGWNDADDNLLARQSPDSFEQIFESISGPNLWPVIQHAIRLGQNDSDNGRAIGAAVREALLRIARKSPIRAKRLERLGISEVPISPG